jgi:hypothetical protein
VHDISIEYLCQARLKTILPLADFFADRPDDIQEEHMMDWNLWLTIGVCVMVILHREVV